MRPHQSTKGTSSAFFEIYIADMNGKRETRNKPDEKSNG
jgi:hypothetical protein